MTITELLEKWKLNKESKALECPLLKTMDDAHKFADDVLSTGLKWNIRIDPEDYLDDAGNRIFDPVQRIHMMHLEWLFTRICKGE